MVQYGSGASEYKIFLFFSTLRRTHVNYFYKIQEAEELLFDHIEVYYNRQRSHSSLDFVSPVQFEVNAA
ncbi:integrase core domain protein [Leptospira noguchii str. 1993005606]|uniref:Integrase core domain protein n=1 Tax=Leptospira noguchii str. 2007001578 TaxID=1049974 RepID=A0ABP2TAJ0_9LEPT|nr:integrase core domain protein [Leptospira noguchii str. 2007001578]EPE83629.1 integrase core domain protein [Leptospira noguchii str. 1993005606]